MNGMTGIEGNVKLDVSGDHLNGKNETVVSRDKKYNILLDD